MTNKKKKQVEPDEDEVGAEEIVAAINRIDKGIKRINKSGLTRRALVVLLKDATVKVKTSAIEQVLDGLDELKEKYLEES